MFLAELASREGVSAETMAAWLLSGAPVAVSASSDELAAWRAARPLQTLNRDELASAFGVSKPTVDEWIDRGCPIRERGRQGVPHQFDLEEVRAWRGLEAARLAETEAEKRRQIDAMQDTFFSADEMGDGDGGKLSTKARIDLRNLELLEIKVAAQKGGLIQAEDIAADYSAMFGFFNRALMGLAGWLSRTHGIDKALVTVIDHEARRILTEMARLIRDPALRPDEAEVPPAS